MSELVRLIPLTNGAARPLTAAPRMNLLEFRMAIAQAVEAGQRVSSFFGIPTTRVDYTGASQPAVELCVVLTDDADGTISVGRTLVQGKDIPSLATRCPQVHLFEREIHEQCGLLPEGHPWLKPVRFEGPIRPDPDTQAPPIGVTDFYRVEGLEIHEVAVGPVHAGIIEPGHFRFQCHGEHVFHLEISLGYQHRGIERAMVGGPSRRTITQMETIAGDTTIGHTTAYCQTLEALSATSAPARAHAIRGIALELERLANHVGDLGALANDVGYLPTASYCGRIRGDFLNMTAVICGSRFGRGLVRPGGVRFDIDDARRVDLLNRLDAAWKDTQVAVNLLWDTPSVMARFEETGPVSAQTARDIGLVGPAARACGLEMDVRNDHPAGIFRLSHIPISTWNAGDVFARAWVRWLEIGRSVTFIREQLESLPAGPIHAAAGGLAPDSIAVSLVEGWRGEICHTALTDEQGRLKHYKIVDPSFHNWFGLAYALRNQQISDFPLCNKSFNLSYCGFDL